MKKRLIAFVLMLLMVTMPLTSFAQSSGAVVMDEKASTPKALSFTTKTLDGKPFSSDVIKNYDLVVLNCWGEWCGPCCWELPFLQQISENYKNVLVLGLWYGNSAEEALKTAQEAGVTYPLIHPSGVLEDYLWASNSFPHTFFFDCIGNQVGDMEVGAIDYNGWKHNIEERLAMLPSDNLVIVTQPKDATVYEGENATFTVEAKGEGTIEYQWFSRPSANADWTLVDGATKDSYTVIGTKDNNGWQFRCGVKNEDSQTYSNAATLTVKPIVPPTIKTQPKSANVKSGAKAKFTVKVKEKNVTYQWFSKAPGAANWAAVAGETKATLTVVATKANSGTQYRCRVRTAEGGEADTIAATLTVKIQPPVIKTPPKSLAVVSGKKAKFAVKASGPKLTYTWFSRPNAEAAWTPVAGQNKSSLSVVASKANDGSQYYCHIQNTDGEVDSAVVTLTVTPQPPTIKTQPKDAKVKLGAKAKFKVKATGKDVTYQWYYRTSEDGEWILIDGATAATYTVTATAEKIGWQYRCLAKNADGQAYSDPVTLRLK